MENYPKLSLLIWSPTYEHKPKEYLKLDSMSYFPPGGLPDLKVKGKGFP